MKKNFNCLQWKREKYDNEKQTSMALASAMILAASSSASLASNCDNNNEIYSFHNQGAIIGMGDGRVIFLSMLDALKKAKLQPQKVSV